MKYIVIELQTNEDGSVGTLVYAFNTEAEALARYYQTLASAVTSLFKCHSAILCTEEAQYLRRDFFRHDAEPVVEPNEE